MATSADIASRARIRLRDFPVFFEVPYAVPVSTLRLPHPLVETSGFEVWQPDGTDVPDGWSLDPRNGLLKFADPTAFDSGVGCSGYHYTWFLNDDLEYFASVTTTYHDYDRPNPTFSDVEVEVMALGTCVQALWSLAAEFGTDIDVSTPEGMAIPAHQRFAQTWQMLQVAQQQYKDQAAMLGVGLDKIEQFTLRRVAYLTNRYVPLYVPREVGDPRWPERVFPPIPDGTMAGDGSQVVPISYPYEVPFTNRGDV